MRAYRSIPVGDPLEPSTLMGPLIDRAAYEAMQAALNYGGDLSLAQGVQFDV